MPVNEKPSLAPLRARAGAAYTCFGDGLCCTGIHGLGPLTKLEVRKVRALDPLGAGWDSAQDDYMLRVAADDGCRFLLPNGYCDIHSSQGPEHKPHGCRKFPYGLTATPAGGRVFTEHRCPCRTLGERPPLSVEAALESLRPDEGDLDSDVDVRSVKLAGSRRVPFRRWEALEAPMLAALAAGVHASEALAARAFPALRGTTWARVGRDFVEARDGSRFGFALAWFGDTVGHLVEGSRTREPLRPWSDAFDRAEARSPVARTAREVVNDFVADQLFSLRWAEDIGFARFAAEIVTRVAVADDIIARLTSRGLRPDRAAAEAVMIIEVVGASEHWEPLALRIKP